MLANIWHYVEGAFVFLFILMVLVAAHEYGHYLFARLFGMGVEEFSIGMFGKKPIVVWRKSKYRLRLRPNDDPYKRSMQSGSSLEGGTGISQEDPVVIDGPSGRYLEETTVFTVRPWPIGGFVRIKGMLPEEDGSEVHIPGGFYSKSPWKRIAVLLAGPVFSIAAGVLVMIPLITTMGLYKPSNDPVIGQIIPGSPAEKAGMQEGDRIVSIDGRPVTSFYQVSSEVRESAGKRLKFVYERKGKDYTADIVPYLSEVPMAVVGPDQEPTGEVKRFALMGVQRVFKHYSATLPEAIMLSVKVPMQNIKGIVSIFHEPSIAKDTVSGPVGMLGATTEAVQDGTSSVIMLAATISIALGIFNLLPVYPMDGGQMVVAIAEIFRGGRRLSLHVQTVIGTVGLSLLALIAIGALTLDIGRLTGKQSPTSPIPPPIKK